MRIIVDAQGGDNAPYEVIKGCVEAVQEDSTLEIVLAGKEDEIKPILNEMYNGKAIGILNAAQVITNDDIPTKAIREKKDSSIVRALSTLREDESYDAVVSAGSTGALLTGALLICKRIKGITRPALVPVAPTIFPDKKFVLVDCGANADCKPVNLQHFALMGSEFIRAMFGIENPKVALLSNGTEEGKGNELTKESFELLKGMSTINFVGNCEARDMLFGNYDVIVCDGFTGNVALKANEGMAKAIMSMLKSGIKSSGIKGAIGALCLKKTLKNIKRTMDVNEQAGGAFLGVERVVIKAHGSSKAISFKRCIEQAKTLVNADIINKIKQGLAKDSAEEDIKSE